MSNSQEQSLDENAVFLPVNESSPEFLHCEKERQAVERLLSAGPEAFYSAVGTERSGCFLSSEEVSQITSWAKSYHFYQLQVQREENGVDGSSEMEDFCSTYFPCHSDTPAPYLDLGWPEKSSRVQMGSVTVHASPPAEGEPPVREIIRRHLQKASQVCKYDVDIFLRISTADIFIRVKVKNIGTNLRNLYFTGVLNFLRLYTFKTLHFRGKFTFLVYCTIYFCILRFYAKTFIN